MMFLHICVGCLGKGHVIAHLYRLDGAIMLAACAHARSLIQGLGGG
jgi:hypothetical protein